MKTALQKKIRKKLHHYKYDLNQPDGTLPMQVSVPKKVAVIGGGIAGISAASNLAERGFKVQLFEKDHFLGGKVGAWTFESQGETLNVEHGFHAFFRQYYNLRQYLKKIGAFKHLIPIDDYVILFGKNQRQGFKGLHPTPGLNVLDLRKHGVFNFLTLISPFSMPFLHLLKFRQDKTFKKFDRLSFEKYARRTLMPSKMRLVFNSFARAFFSQPEKMSMAELIKGFHFYFLSSEDGLLYDVLDDDFQVSFIDYCEQFLKKHGVEILKNTPVHTIAQSGNTFKVNGNEVDYVVLCTDVKHIVPLVENSPALMQYAGFYRKIQQLKPSDRYAILRIWTDTFEKPGLPFFIFTDRLKCLDSITLYHRMEKTSQTWSETHKGGIYELHSYALPDDLTEEAEIRQVLMDELFHYMPELKNLTIKHSYFQHRQDFPAFHTGLYENRPAIETEIPGLYLAGDWVKMDNCTMLMEAAYTSGAIAANYILTQEGLQENLLTSVPVRGVLA